jgi:hypothetical protein
VLREAGAKVLGALIAAIASISFVALTGAIVLWTRFWSAGLPADQAVAVVPRQELVATGAVVLVAFFVIGLASVAIAYLLDRRGLATLPTRWGLLVLAALGVLGAIAVADPAEGNEGLACLTVVVTTFLSGVAAWRFSRPVEEPPPAAPPSPGPPPAPSGPPDTSSSPPPPSNKEETDAESEGRVAQAVERSVEALVQAATGRSYEESAAMIQTTPQAPPPRVRLATTAYIAQIVLAGVCGLVLYLCFRDEAWVVASFGLVVVLYIACLSVARSSTAFRWYGVAVVVAVAIFGATMTALRNLDTKKIQPVAALRTQESQPICGVYVTESDDRLFFGRLDGEDEHGRTASLFWLAKDDLAGWAIGRLQGQDEIQEVAGELATSLLADRQKKTAATNKTTSEAGNKRKKSTTSTVTSEGKQPPGAVKDCRLYVPSRDLDAPHK